jgi:hypothetical protein
LRTPLSRTRRGAGGRLGVRAREQLRHMSAAMRPHVKTASTVLCSDGITSHCVQDAAATAARGVVPLPRHLEYDESKEMQALVGNS